MISYAIIGTGKIVETFLEAAAKTPELRLTGVYFPEYGAGKGVRAKTWCGSVL